MGAYDSFGFAFRAGTKPPTPQGLAGRRILLGSLAWQPVADLELAQLGLAPGSVTYVEAGARWGEALARGEQARRRPVLGGPPRPVAGPGPGLDYLTPPEFSRLPSAASSSAAPSSPTRPASWSSTATCAPGPWASSSAT
jgi:hypothetical protein